MQYKAVILNFDHRTVQYVPVKDMPTLKKVAIASSSGSAPPAKRPKK